MKGFYKSLFYWRLNYSLNRKSINWCIDQKYYERIFLPFRQQRIPLLLDWARPEDFWRRQAKSWQKCHQWGQCAPPESIGGRRQPILRGEKLFFHLWQKLFNRNCALTLKNYIGYFFLERLLNKWRHFQNTYFKHLKKVRVSFIFAFLKIDS